MNANPNSQSLKIDQASAIRADYAVNPLQVRRPMATLRRATKRTQGDRFGRLLRGQVVNKHWPLSYWVKKMHALAWMKGRQ